MTRLLWWGHVVTRMWLGYVSLVRLGGVWAVVRLLATVWGADNGALLLGSWGGKTDPCARVRQSPWRGSMID
jgi:CDP-diglyceride synthetase